MIKIGTLLLLLLGNLEIKYSPTKSVAPYQLLARKTFLGVPRIIFFKEIENWFTNEVARATAVRHVLNQKKDVYSPFLGVKKY